MSATFAVTGLLTSSTGSALLRKVLFQMDGEGLGGKVHTFEKPWFTTWESAAACWVSILIFWAMQSASRHMSSKDDASEKQPLLPQEDKTPDQQETEGAAEGQEEHKFEASWKEVGALSVPGLLSVMSIIVQGMGLRYVSASVSMMLSGCCIIFTAILSVLLLKCRLSYLHLTGIALTIAGIVIVSSTNLIWPEVSHTTHHHGSSPGAAGNTWEMVLGIGLTLASTLILAMRLVAEEFALQGTRMHPLQVLGYEGMWGTLGVGILGLPIAALLPGHDVGGVEESTADSFVMLWQNPGLNAVNLVFFLCVVGLNVFGLMVTTRLGSVFRAVLLTARTASVWAVDLVLYYCHVGGGAVGEPWISPGSWLQLFGFALLLLGTIIYAQGSSVVALDKEGRKLNEEDPEADGPDSLQRELSVSAVTRMRPYTSLYIPHGPRDITATLPHTQSLPFAVMARGGSPGTWLQHYSYTPGMALQGSSPRSILSDGPPPSPGDPGGNLFMQTLTHRSSWVLPQPRLPRRQSAPSGLSVLTEPRRFSLDSAGGSSDDVGRQSGVEGASPHTPMLEGDSGSEIEAEKARLDSRRSSRRSAGAMPAVAEGEDSGPPGQEENARLSPHHVFGQSPVPELLISRRSTGRRRSNPLPSFQETEEDAGDPVAEGAVGHPSGAGPSSRAKQAYKQRRRKGTAVVYDTPLPEEEDEMEAALPTSRRSLTGQAPGEACDSEEEEEEQTTTAAPSDAQANSNLQWNGEAMSL